MTDETSPYGAAPATPPARVRTRSLQLAKERGERIAMLTSYDSLTAALFDEAGADVLLVGDSAGNNVMGLDSTLPVTVEDMLVFTRAVVRGARRALVVADLPFGSYENSPEQAFETAARLMKEGGAQAVKLEGGTEMAPTIRHLSRRGVPVMAHIGFTPQSEHQLCGYRVQGRGEDAERVLADARAVEKAGAFAVVLEMVPAEAAARVEEALGIPTIGIGAGAATTGQVLVWQDAFGLREGRMPRFVKQYARLADELRAGVRGYLEDVRSGSFPGPEHSF